MDKIVEYMKKNLKLFLFVIIFCFFTFVYNQNSQTLNYVLKRGTILEYSIKNSSEINIEKIKEKLSQLNIKYSYVDVIDNSEFEIYDFDLNKVDKSLSIGLAVLANDKKADLFNKISDYIFENYQDSKLINVKSLNNNYHSAYSSMLNFLGILFVSGFVWLILMYLIYDIKTINQKIKDNFVQYFKKQKGNFKNLIQKTKEKGIKYFICRILFDDNQKEDEKETSITREIISTIVFVVVAVVIIRTFVGELRWIPSGSMRLTILERDRVFVETLKYPQKTIERGDILVFYPPSTTLSNSPIAIFSRLTGILCKDIAYIKRVIGLPGEKFEIKEDKISGEYRVFINDKPLQEPYVSSKIEWTPCMENMNCGPFVIPEDSYFMMGDNRNNSQDSRFWGFLDKNRVIGRANFMFWPIGRINVLRDKYLNLHKNKYENNRYILNRYEY